MPLPTNLTPTTPMTSPSHSDLHNDTAIALEDTTSGHDHDGVNSKTIASHGASVHTNRTRRIPLVPIFNRRTGAYDFLTSDGHGSLSQRVHIDQADNDASYKIIDYGGIRVPADDAGSGWSLNIAYTSAATSGNIVFTAEVYELEDGDTSHTARLSTTNASAVPGVANTIEVISLAFGTSPSAAGMLIVEIGLASNHASDTTSAQRSLWDAWLEYTADM